MGENQEKLNSCTLILKRETQETRKWLVSGEEVNMGWSIW